MKHIVAKRTPSCWAALWCCAREMGSSCGSALLFWDMKSSLLFYGAKLERQMRDEDRKAKMLTLDDARQVLSRHKSLSSLTTRQTRPGGPATLRGARYTWLGYATHERRTYLFCLFTQYRVLSDRRPCNRSTADINSSHLRALKIQFSTTVSLNICFHTHGNALGCFCNAWDIKEEQKPGCRSPDPFASEAFDGLFKV